MFICLYGTQFSSKRDPSFSRVYTTNNTLLTFPFICPTSFLWIGFHSNFNSLLVPQVSKVTNDNIIHCTFSRLFNVFEVTCSSFQQNNTTKKLIKASKSDNPSVNDVYSRMMFDFQNFKLASLHVHSYFCLI